MSARWTAGYRLADGLPMCCPACHRRTVLGLSTLAIHFTHMRCGGCGFLGEVPHAQILAFLEGGYSTPRSASGGAAAALGRATGGAAADRRERGANP